MRDITIMGRSAPAAVTNGKFTTSGGPWGTPKYEPDDFGTVLGGAKIRVMLLNRVEASIIGLWNVIIIVGDGSTLTRGDVLVMDTTGMKTIDLGDGRPYAAPVTPLENA